MTIRGWQKDQRGGVAIEFTLVGLVFMLLAFGAIEIGLLWWLQGSIQYAAASAARCAAIGFKYGTSTCNSNRATQTYAAQTASNWLVANAITTGDVTVTTPQQGTECNIDDTLSAVLVTIKSSYFSTLPQPLANRTLSASSCLQY